MEKKKSLTLVMTLFLLCFYMAIVMYVFFAVLHIEALKNFVCAMLFELLGFAFLVGIVISNIVDKSMKTGYFISLLMVTIFYNAILDVINMLFIFMMNNIFFVLVHLVLLFIYCIITVPMFLVGRK